MSGHIHLFRVPYLLMSTRINKFLAEHSVASRREADRLIEAKRVRINGKVATLGATVEDTDIVKVDGDVIGGMVKRVVIALHKPVGFITSTDTRLRDTVMDLIDFPGRMFPVGRLDVQSSGLLLFTNDGDLADRLTHPRYGHEKIYEVKVDKVIPDGDLDLLRQGILIEGKKTLPAEVVRLAPKRLRITLREGRNRQVRKMCAAVGAEVEELVRTSFAGILLGRLAVGSWRYLNEHELRALGVEKR